MPDRSILVQFGDEIPEAIHHQVFFIHIEPALKQERPVDIIPQRIIEVLDCYDDKFNSCHRPCYGA